MFYYEKIQNLISSLILSRRSVATTSTRFERNQIPSFFSLQTVVHNHSLAF
ncbi:MAG: hypothetical protein KBC22_02425 [Candidatus Pacebacteria bacterium]|nr:hypothetical protein [Candidatus Paceibacterota bacterium]